MSGLVFRSQYCKAKSVRTFGLTVYNSTFKEDIGILSFFKNYDFKVKPIYIIRDVEVVVKK